MKNLIEEGDIVLVETSKGSFVHGEVLYAPFATGDCWHIRSSLVPDSTGYIGDHDGSLVYIQQFITMKLMDDTRLLNQQRLARASSSETDTPSSI